MKRWLWIIPAAVIVTVLAGPAQAGELAGVTMPDRIEIEGRSCELNGMGLRKILIVKVYVSGLYLENPVADADEVINSDQTKRLIVDWIYKKGAGIEKLQKEYRERIEANTPERSGELDSKIDRFISTFTKPVVGGDKFIYTYVPGKGTSISLSGEEKGTIEGEDFMKALFRVWFGQKPFDKKLKKGLLGNR